MKHTKPMSPTRFLARHEFRAHLRAKGIRPAMLDSVRLIPIDGAAFCNWPTMAPVAWPEGFQEARRVWAALKWWVMEDPPQSPDTAACWDLISGYFERLNDERYRNRAKVQRAADMNRTKGQRTQAKVREAYRKKFAAHKPGTRVAAATAIAPMVNLSFIATLRHLEKLNLPK